ncbi:hypothetical protein [Kitasatospora sp. NPDC057223]|uniref:hypothetical protein n=1 Tax=Kitasatospora sp. NPDC057223 TaxID=3346055 RepID=UPI003636497E
MSFDLQVALGVPPDRGAPGGRLALPAAPHATPPAAPHAGLRGHTDPRPHPSLGHSPVTFVSTELWEALAALAISPDAIDATVLALLGALAAQATDAALAPGNESAPPDDLYVVSPAHIGAERREVWFQRDGVRGPITARLLPRA